MDLVPCVNCPYRLKKKERNISQGLKLPFPRDRSLGDVMKRGKSVQHAFSVQRERIPVTGDQALNKISKTYWSKWKDSKLYAVPWVFSRW